MIMMTINGNNKGLNELFVYRLWMKWEVWKKKESMKKMLMKHEF